MLHINKKIILILSLVILNGTFFVYSYSQDYIEKVKEHQLKGKNYYQQGKYREAQEEFQKALELIRQEKDTTIYSIQTTPSIKKETKVEEKEVSILPQEAKVAPEVKVAPEAKPQLEYIIGEEDVLNISVWQDRNLDQEVIVRPDGKISFPLIGEIQAVGLTITQLDEELTDRLRAYIRDPEVSISIKKLGGKKVIVLGEVVKPGVYSVTGAKTVLEAIGLAGGFTNHAVASSVIVIRGGFENPEAKRINLSKALKGEVRENVNLHSEDIVFIPKKFIANVNYFLGQILDPISKGAYTARELEKY